MDKPTIQPAAPPVTKSSRFGRWLSILVFVAAGLVYLSLILKSLAVFIVGEVACVVLAPMVIWMERRRIRRWWNARGLCPKCGTDLREVKGPCPTCGYRRIVE